MPRTRLAGKIICDERVDYIIEFAERSHDVSRQRLMVVHSLPSITKGLCSHKTDRYTWRHPRDRPIILRPNHDIRRGWALPIIGIRMCQRAILLNSRLSSRNRTGNIIFGGVDVPQRDGHNAENNSEKGYPRFESCDTRPPDSHRLTPYYGFVVLP
jgi:hypothetical protein